MSRQCVALAYTARREGDPVERQQDTAVSGFRRRRETEGVSEVGGPVGSGVVERSLRPGDHHRTWVVVDQIEQKGGLLHRVRSVGHHDAPYVGGQRITHCPGDLELVGGIEGEAGAGDQVMRDDLGTSGCELQRVHEVPCPCAGPPAFRRGTAGNGATSGDQADAQRGCS
jgi:hypothetical protein